MTRIFFFTVVALEDFRNSYLKVLGVRLQWLLPNRCKSMAEFNPENRRQPLSDCDVVFETIFCTASNKHQRSETFNYLS
jgi:hypothetical protein